MKKKDVIALSKNQGLWRRIKGIHFVYHSEWSDPSLIYKGYEFNFHAIEDALWSMFLEENPDFTDADAGTNKAESAFTQYLSTEAKPYLEDVIAGGYFSKGNYSWRDE